MAVLDIQEVKLATQQREAAEGRRRIDAILDNTTDASYALDLDWRVLHSTTRRRTSWDGKGRACWAGPEDEVPSLVGTKLDPRCGASSASRPPVTCEFHPIAEGLHEVRAYASAAEITGYFTDLTSPRCIGLADAGHAT